MTLPTELRANAPAFVPRFDSAPSSKTSGEKLEIKNGNADNTRIDKNGVQNDGNRAGSRTEFANRQKKNMTTKRDRQSGRGKGKCKNTKLPVDRNQDRHNSKGASNSEPRQKARKSHQRNRNRRHSNRNRPGQKRESTQGKSTPYDEELYHQSDQNLHENSVPAENSFPALVNAAHRTKSPSVWTCTSSDHLIFQPLIEYPSNSDAGIDEFARLGLQRLSASKMTELRSASSQTTMNMFVSGLSRSIQTKDLGEVTADGRNEGQPSANRPTNQYHQKPKWNMNRLRDRWWRTLALQRLHRDLIDELKLHFADRCLSTKDDSENSDSDSASYLEPVEIGPLNHPLPSEPTVQSTIVQSLDGSISSHTEGVLNAIGMDNERALDAILFRSKRMDHPAEEMYDPFRSVAKKALFTCVEQDKPHLLRIVLRHMGFSASPRRMKKQEASETQVSPLMMAADLGQNQCLAILLSNEERHTTSLSSRDLDGNNVFHYCCRGQGDEGSLRTLLKEVSSGTKWKQQALSKLLLLRNKTGKTSLHVACEDGKQELVQAFLSLCSSSLLSKLLSITDMSNQTPLLAAVASNRTEVVTCLIMWRGNNNRNAWKKVSQIPNCGTEPMVKQQESSIPPCALVWAAKNGVLDMIHVILQFSSVSGSDYRVTEALSEVIQSKASDEDKLESARILILAGGNAFADVSTVYSDSSSSTAPKAETPISLASKTGATKILQMLVQVGSKELQVKQQLRRRDPKLQQRPESFFRAIEAAENTEMKSALTNALVESLFYGWYYRESSLRFQHTSSAVTLYRLGVQLREIDIVQLWQSMKWNDTNLTVRSIDGDQSRCFMTSYEHHILDAHSNWSKVSDTDRTLLSGYSRILLGLGWMKDQLGRFSCNCPWIAREGSGNIKAESDLVFLVVRDGERFVAHASILSLKSEKLASAIRFAAMNDNANNADRTPEVFVDIDGRMVRYMLQHIYHGSVITGWPTSEDEIFRDLLDLIVVAEEALCPSLVQECEMRLLSSNPTQCFCWSCSKAVRASLENSRDATECLYLVEGPGVLITGSRSLDVLAITEFVSGLQLEYSICTAPLPYSSTRYMPGSETWEKLEKTWKASGAIRLLKDQAIITILLRFSEVIECSSYQESVQYNAVPASSSDLHPMLLLETCLEEFHQSSLLSENTFRKMMIKS